MRQNFITQFIQLLKHWLCDVQSGVVEKNWAHSVEQLLAAGVAVLVYLINLLSILLRSNGYTMIRKDAVDQKGGRPLDSDHDLYWVQVWLWEVLWSFFLVQPLNWLSYKMHFSSHVTVRSRIDSLLHRIREGDTLKNDFLKICCQLMRHPLIKL